MRKRKLFAVIFVFALALSLFAGCGSTKEEAKVTPQETAAASADSAAETKSEAPAAAAETKSEAPAAAEETKAEEPAEEEVTAQSLVDGYFDKADEIKSLIFNMIMDVNMDMTLFGQETAVIMNMDVDASVYDENAHMKGSMHMSSYGEEESEDVETYIMAENGKYVSYSYDKETDSWTKSASEQPVFNKEMIPKVDASKFKLEEKDGRYQVSGDVDLKEMIEALGKSFGDIFSGVAGVDAESLTGTAKVEYYFNKETKELEAVNIDMASAFEEIFKNMFTALFEGQDLGEDVDLSSIVDVTVSSFLVKLDKMQINKGEEIVLPDAAKNAEEVDLSDEEFSETEEEGEEVPLSVDLAESFDFLDSYGTLTFKGTAYEMNQVVLSDFLQATGLELDDGYVGEKVAAGETTFAVAYLNDDYDSISFDLRNATEEEADITDCIIYGVDISRYGQEAFDVAVADVKIGATMDELIEKFGNPTYGYESELFKSYSWEGENGNYLSFYFSGDSKESSGMSLVIYNW